jgi:hypothetical protein
VSLAIPTEEPTRLIKGDTVKWSRTHGDFDAATCELKYSFANTSVQFTKTAVAQSDGTWLVTFTPAESNALTIGEYGWFARVTDGSDKFVLWRHVKPVLVYPNLETETSGYDFRSFALTQIETLEGIIAGKLDMSAYSIRDRSKSFWSHKDLRDELDYWKKVYAMECREDRVDQGLGSKGVVRCRLMF